MCVLFLCNNHHPVYNSHTMAKKLAIDTLFKPDGNGCSEWISREEISHHPALDWGKNGAARHGIYFGDKRYKWEKQGTRGITALRTVGFSDSKLYGATRPIRDDIHKFHKAMGCVVCGSSSDLVTDHKNDLYNDPRVLNKETQTLGDFRNVRGNMQYSWNPRCHPEQQHTISPKIKLS